MATGGEEFLAEPRQGEHAVELARSATVNLECQIVRQSAGRLMAKTAAMLGSESPHAFPELIPQLIPLPGIHRDSCAAQSEQLVIAHSRRLVSPASALHQPLEVLAQLVWIVDAQGPVQLHRLGVEPHVRDQSIRPCPRPCADHPKQDAERIRSRHLRT
ncbi:hypothetical protein STPH1_6236 [Streptomyces sp. OM5714]|nr:hypothetical protein STPH1_6236 [Streptomyces sp. OM5714]